MEQKTRNQYGLWFWCYKGKPITSKSSEDETTNSEPEIKVFDTLEEVRAYEKKIDQFCPIEVWKQEYIYELWIVTGKHLNFRLTISSFIFT